MYDHQHIQPDPVPSSVLFQLSRHDPMRDTGQASDENNALLSMYLPDLCGELVTNRAELDLLRREVSALRSAQRTVGEKLASFFGFTRTAANASTAQIARGL